MNPQYRTAWAANVRGVSSDTTYLVNDGVLWPLHPHRDQAIAEVAATASGGGKSMIQCVDEYIDECFDPHVSCEIQPHLPPQRRPRHLAPSNTSIRQSQLRTTAPTATIFPHNNSNSSIPSTLPLMTAPWSTCSTHHLPPAQVDSDTLATTQTL